MAENSLFIMMASILHILKIEKALNEDGSEVEFEPEWISGPAV
jgi:hypothetical protein